MESCLVQDNGCEFRVIEASANPDLGPISQKPYLLLAYFVNMVQFVTALLEYNENL